MTVINGLVVAIVGFVALGGMSACHYRVSRRTGDASCTAWADAFAFGAAVALVGAVVSGIALGTS